MRNKKEMKVTTEHYKELIDTIEQLEIANSQWETEYDKLYDAFENYVCTEEKQKVITKTIGFR